MNPGKGEVYALLQEGEKGDRISESVFVKEYECEYLLWPFGASPEPAEPLSNPDREVRRAEKLLRRFLEEGFPFRAGPACSACSVARFCPLG